MARTQIQLEEEQYRKLQRLAIQRSQSIAELVRRGVDRMLAEAESDARWAAAWEVIGSARDVEKREDVAERHDEYLTKPTLPESAS